MGEFWSHLLKAVTQPACCRVCTGTSMHPDGSVVSGVIELILVDWYLRDMQGVGRRAFIIMVTMA